MQANPCHHRCDRSKPYIQLIRSALPVPNQSMSVTSVHVPAMTAYKYPALLLLLAQKQKSRPEEGSFDHPDYLSIPKAQSCSRQQPWEVKDFKCSNYYHSLTFLVPPPTFFFFGLVWFVWGSSSHQHVYTVQPIFFEMGKISPSFCIQRMHTVQPMHAIRCCLLHTLEIVDNPFSSSKHLK
jgi:hypothetical protein